MKYKTIIFDLDGTLLDTLDDITGATNETLSLMNFDYRVTREDTRQMIGDGAKILSERVFEKFTIDFDLFDDYFSLYKKIYFQHTSLTRPFDQVVKTLTNLKEKGYQLIVISNKPDKTCLLCTELYFKNIFDDVIGHKENMKPKPDREVFEYIKNKYNLNEKEVLYVGDMNVDIIFSKNIGVDIAIFSSGYGKIVSSSEVNYIFSSYEEFMSILEDL